MNDLEKQKTKIKNIFKSSGFVDVRFSLVEYINPQNLDLWLKKKFHASMSWMAEKRDLRLDPTKLLPDAKTVISLAHPYLSSNSKSKHIHGISHYAQGSDYHNVLRKKLKAAIKEINIIIPEFSARIAVDSAPLMEKYWAVKSGLGWQGKNANVISRDFGSYFFLAELLTPLEFPADNPIKNYCGNCTRCLDACPTHAIVDPYIVDSSKCISYLTIEDKRQRWDDYFYQRTRDRIFGCDICQEVCPWNKFSVFTIDERFYPRENNILHSNIYWFLMPEEEFNYRFRGSAVMRAGHRMFLRNLQYAAGNDGLNNLSNAKALWKSYEDNFIIHNQYWTDVYDFFYQFEIWWQSNTDLISLLWSNHEEFGIQINEIVSFLERHRTIVYEGIDLMQIIKNSCASKHEFEEWIAAKFMKSVKEVDLFYINIEPQNVITAIWHILIYQNDRKKSYFEQLVIPIAYLKKIIEKGLPSHIHGYLPKLNLEVAID